MKNALFLTVAFFGTFAFGSHTVCSSPKLYYSLVRHDFGIAPQPGMELGTKTIFAQGKLLVSEKMVQGLGGFTISKYEVSLTGPKTTLQQTGSQVAGSTIFTQTAILSSATPGNHAEIERSTVVCEQTWAMVP